MWLMISAQMFSEVILAAPMYVLFRKFNILDSLAAIIIETMAVCLPMSLWFLYSQFSEIPIEVEEAALVDGASRLETVYHIIIPLAMPGMIAVSLFVFIRAYGDLLFSRTFITTSGKQTLAMALMNFQSIYKTTWETQMVASTISMIPTIIIFIFIQKYLEKGIIGTGSKG